MMRGVTFVGGWLSFRALFNWIRPSAYVPTLVLSPIFQVIFFVYLGRAAAAEDDTFFIVGNAFQCVSLTCVFGIMQCVVNERNYASLPLILLSPANRFSLYLGRTLPPALAGIAVGTATLLISIAIFGRHIGAAQVGAVCVLLAAASISCAAFGLCLAAFGLRYRDILAISNLAYLSLLVLATADVPSGRLPRALRWVGDCLPLTHALSGARRILAGGHVVVISTSGIELLVGLAWATCALVLLRRFELATRRDAAFSDV